MSNRAELIRRCSISDDLMAAHKLDANPCADAIQMEPRWHQRGHAEQQVIEKLSVSMYLAASSAQSWRVPPHKGQSVESPRLCVLYVCRLKLQRDFTPLKQTVRNVCIEEHTAAGGKPTQTLGFI